MTLNYNRIEIAEELLKNGADPMSIGDWGDLRGTCLEWAEILGRVEILRLLRRKMGEKTLIILRQLSSLLSIGINVLYLLLI